MNFSLDEQLKKRLVGAAVLVSLLIIFLPSFWETDYSLDAGVSGRDVPESPFEKENFESKIQPLPSELSKPAVISAPQPSVEPVVKQEPAEAKVSIPTPKPVVEKPVTNKSAANKSQQALTAWAVQVASFPERSTADQLTRELQKLKYPAFVVPVAIKGKNWYRVRIGPEVDKQRASLMVENLRKIKGKGLKPHIIRHP